MIVKHRDFMISTSLSRKVGKCIKRGELHWFRIPIEHKNNASKKICLYLLLLFCDFKNKQTIWEYVHVIFSHKGLKSGTLTVAEMM